MGRSRKKREGFSSRGLLRQECPSTSSELGEGKPSMERAGLGQLHVSALRCPGLQQHLPGRGWEMGCSSLSGPGSHELLG